jgi:parallel beta-helix repeat protein
LTEGNVVYDNAISDSDIGIRATRSHNNIVHNTVFSDIESSEYRLLADSSLTIRGQQFNDDDVLITEGDSQTIGSTVEIVGSGIIEVREGGGEDDDDEEEGDSFNTDIQSYRRTLSDGDSITVTSSSSSPSEPTSENPSEIPLI